MTERPYNFVRALRAVSVAATRSREFANLPGAVRPGHRWSDRVSEAAHLAMCLAMIGMLWSLTPVDPAGDGDVVLPWREQPDLDLLADRGSWSVTGRQDSGRDLPLSQVGEAARLSTAAYRCIETPSHHELRMAEPELLSSGAA